MQKHRRSVVGTALLVVALAALGLAASAQAKLVGNYTKFAQCPYANLEVKKCVYSTTNSGEVVLGSKKVPIVNPVVLQGGTLKAVEGVAKFVAASNGVTLSTGARRRGGYRQLKRTQRFFPADQLRSDLRKRPPRPQLDA